MVKVSIIIPIVDNDKLINKCLETILNQEFDDYEVIVVNSSSDDNVNKYLKENKDSKLKIINKKNISIGMAKNIGIDEANGEYITIIYGNDYIDSMMLKKFYEYAKKYDLDFVTSPYNKITKNKERIYADIKYKMGNIKTSPQIIHFIEYNLKAKLIRKKLLNDYNITFIENKKYEDIPFICKILLYSKLVGYLKDNTYYTYDNKKEIIDENVFDLLDVLKVVKEDYQKEFSIRKEIDYIIIDKIINMMILQKKQKNKQIRKDFIKAGYEFLDKNIKNWQNNLYYKEISFRKRMMINHKMI